MTRLLKAWVLDILKQQTGNAIFFLLYGFDTFLVVLTLFSGPGSRTFKKYQSGCTFVILSKIFTS